MTSAAGRLLLDTDRGIAELSLDPSMVVVPFVCTERIGVAVLRALTKLTSGTRRPSSSMKLVLGRPFISSFLSPGTDH